MHIVNPSGVKFSNKYLNWFHCLGLEDHGFGGAANGGKKAASNAKRYPLCENRRVPCKRNQPAFAKWVPLCIACRFLAPVRSPSEAVIFKAKAAKPGEVFICKFYSRRIDNVHCTLYNLDYT